MIDVRDVQVARRETWGGGPRSLYVIVCWDLIADCGCTIYEGVRVDRAEPVVAFTSCAEHEQQIDELHRTYAAETNARAEFDVVGVDDERPLHVVLLERFREAVNA
jgi:hypothetical protein